MVIVSQSDVSEVLERTLEERRADLKKLSVSAAQFYAVSKFHDDLQFIEEELNQAEILLRSGNLDGVSERLESALARANDLRIRIEKRVFWWQLAVGVYAVFLVIIAGVGSFVAWKGEALPFAGLDAARWATLRALVFAFCGALVGGASHLGRILYLAVPKRTFEIRSLLWYFLRPILGGGLSVVVFLFLRAGLITLGLAGAPAGATTVITSSMVFSIGFMVGFSPGTVIERLNATIRALFGVEELRAPSVTAPQVSIKAGRLQVTSSVIGSAATRLAAVNALLQTRDAQTIVEAMTPGERYEYSATFAIPPNLPLEGATVLVKARDESGNEAKSEPVAIPLPPDLLRATTVREWEGEALAEATEREGEASAESKLIGSISGIAFVAGLPNRAGTKVSVDGHPELFAETDPDGRFCIPNVPIGTYTLRVVRDGWVGHKDGVVVESRQAVDAGLIEMR